MTRSKKPERTRMQKRSDDVAKDLISMVVAHVRKGSPKTKKLPSTTKKPTAKNTAEVKENLISVPETGNDVAEQLRKFENMVIIQRLDTLIDMQKMQWEILNRLANVVETISVVNSDSASGIENSSALEELDQLIRGTKVEEKQSQDTDEKIEASKEDEDGTPFPDKERYEDAELFARKLSRVRNDVN